MRSAKLAGAYAAKLGPLQHRRGDTVRAARGQRQTAVGREPPGKSSGIDAVMGRSCPGISASGL